MRTSLIAALSALIFLFPLRLAAEPESLQAESLLQQMPASPSEFDIAPEPGWSLRFGRWLEAQRDSFSDVVTLSAEEIDLYFAAENRVESYRNRTQVLLQFQQRSSEGGDHKLELDVRAKLRLPHTQERLKLTFESAPEDLDGLNERERGQVAGATSSRQAKESAVLGLELDNDGRRWKRNYRVGMHLRFPLDPFLRAVFTRHIDFPGAWDGRFRESLAFFHIQGFKAETRFDLLHRLNDRWLFRSLSAAEFVDLDENWELLQSFSLHQRWTPRTAVEYQLGISGDSQPTLRKSSYWLRAEIRRRLHEDWLYGIVAPELLFARGAAFHPETVLVLKLQVYFGQPAN